MTNKEKYKNFCSVNSDVPIFSQDWWLESVCGEDNWDVVLVEKGGHISASMPYILKKKAIFNMIVMPKLTQTMGVYIKYPKGQKYYKRLSWEKEMMTSIIEQLPEFDYFSQNFNKSITNWLPFYWQGFEQTTKYTYRIENTKLDDLENKFETDIRRRRKKASQLCIEVIESDDIEKFYELNTMTFKRQGMKIPYSFDFVKKIFESCKKYNAVKMYFAKLENQIIAANFLVYDDNTVYYLMGGIDDAKKDLGGMDLILYESIKYALENNKAFDFEGSMIENIEKYFRSFGAVQTPFFTISKVNSRLLKVKNMFKEIIK